jgi:predicted dehydrogenase
MSVTRRRFLHSSLFASAAAAGGLAFPVVSSSARAAGPNDKLRVAILGLNGRGQTHLNNFARRDDCDITVVCDPDEMVGMTKGVGNVEKKTGRKPKYVRDLRQVMEDGNVDIVAIATPNHWHSLGTIWAVQAGKHVYCEKPVSHNVEEGRRAVQAIEKHGTIVQCGTQSRSHESQQEAVAFVQSGGIGEVKLARGLCYKRRGAIRPVGNYDVPASVDYNVYLGPADVEPLSRPKLHYDWHWQYNCGNGDLGNQGIHQMDIARWGLGVEGIGSSVVSYGERLGYEDAGTSANTQVSIHEFAGGKRIIFETRGLVIDKNDWAMFFKDKNGEPYSGNKIGVIFYGSDGYVVSTADYDAAHAYDMQGNITKTFKGGTTEAHFDNFVEAIHKNDPAHLTCPFEEGHLSSALCHLGNISYLLGEHQPVPEITEALKGDKWSTESLERTVQHLRQNGVDPDKTQMALGPKLMLEGETFTGNIAAKANPMLFREGRGEFTIPKIV